MEHCDQPAKCNTMILHTSFCIIVLKTSSMQGLQISTSYRVLSPDTLVVNSGQAFESVEKIRSVYSSLYGATQSHVEKVFESNTDNSLLLCVSATESLCEALDLDTQYNELIHGYLLFIRHITPCD